MTSSRNDQSCTNYRFGAFTLDGARSALFVDGQTVALAPKVVETLRLLVERSGTLVSKDELMRALWPDGFVEESNLTQNVYVLRGVLAAHGLRDVIENIPRRGYRFTEPVVVRRDGQTTGPSSSRWAFVALFVACMALAAAMAASTATRKPIAQLGPDGRRLYALGRYYWSLRTPLALERGRRYFASVAARDPRSALGYSGLADTYTELYDYVCDGKPCATITAAARRYARLAVRVDGSSAEAHTSLAMTLRLFDADDAAADREFRHAIALDPKYSLAHEWYGNMLLAHARIGDARRELELAANLQPVSPATYAWLARDAYYGHRYAEAVTNAREALAITPNRVESVIVLGLALQKQGRYAGAIQTFDRLARIDARCNGANGMIAGVYAAQGSRTRALPLLARQSRSCEPRAYLVLEEATALIALRDYEAALAWLRKAPNQTAMDQAFLAMDPRMDAVRTDPRFNRWTTVP